MDSYLRLHTGLHLVLSATSFHIASSLVYLCPVVSRTLMLGYKNLMEFSLMLARYFMDLCLFDQHRLILFLI